MAETREEVSDLLFSYAAGALDAEGSAHVEALLASEPRLRAELAWYAAVCDGVTDALPPLKGLPSADDVIARIREKTGRGGAARRGEGFFAWLAGPALRPLAGFAAVLILIQGAVIATLIGERAETEAVRSVAPHGKATVFVVAFVPETPEAEIRALLLKAGATIVDGPRQLGDYRVAVPANRAEFARQLFEESGITEYVRAQEQ
jgi:anti-sigma factor RsiW